MIGFEEMLVQLRDEQLSLDNAPASKNAEVLHGLKGKKNQGHIRKFKGIAEYLKPYPLHIITDNASALSIVMQLKSKLLLGLDIETSKTVVHSKAGLIPKISEVRLIQIFDGQTIYVFDCKAIGSIQWMEELKDNHIIAHNAAFEAQHFHYIGIEFCFV